MCDESFHDLHCVRDTARINCAVPTVIAFPLLADMLLWILSWTVVAASSGVVWEFVLHRSLQPDLTLARGAIVFLSLCGRSRRLSKKEIS